MSALAPEQRLQRYKRLATALARRREETWRRIQELVGRYQVGHLLYGRAPAGHLIELRIIRLYKNPLAWASSVGRQDIEPTEDGQQLWKLDRYAYLTLPHRERMLRDAVLQWLKEEGLDRGITAEG